MTFTAHPASGYDNRPFALNVYAPSRTVVVRLMLNLG